MKIDYCILSENRGIQWLSDVTLLDGSSIDRQATRGHFAHIESTAPINDNDAPLLVEKITNDNAKPQ